MHNDLVSREAVLELLRSLRIDWMESGQPMKAYAVDYLIPTIANLPAAGDERWEAKYNELASRIDSYPRTCDVERIAQLTSALLLCRNELAWLFEQTGAKEGGSVWRAYKKADSLLSPPEQEAGDEPGK